MPELPDLQVFSKNLTKELAGKTVKKVKLLVKQKSNASQAQMTKALAGQTIAKVIREGKELHVNFKDGTVLGLHLMLHGQLYIDDGTETHKYVIISLELEDGRTFGMTDFQRQATPKLNPPHNDVEDALSKKINSAFLKEAFAHTNASVKSWLMDQHVIRGIGNAYADEILWNAKLSPFSLCKNIPAKYVTKLAASIKKVLNHGERQILKERPGTISGELRDFLVIHNSKKTESPTGKKILVKVIGGRKTYFTEEQEKF
ncbi:MAG: DNA-formamidopyrimidine glycosylase family protein [Chitinophagaceae bacterium]